MLRFVIYFQLAAEYTPTQNWHCLSIATLISACTYSIFFNKKLTCVSNMQWEYYAPTVVDFSVINNMQPQPIHSQEIEGITLPSIMFLIYLKVTLHTHKSQATELYLSTAIFSCSSEILHTHKFYLYQKPAAWMDDQLIIIIALLFYKCLNTLYFTDEITDKISACHSNYHKLLLTGIYAFS